MVVTAIAMVGIFSYCSNEKNDVKENVLSEEEVSINDQNPYLFIEGEIDEIYSFLPEANPSTGITLSEKEALNNSKIFREAVKRVMATAIIDFENKDIIIPVNDGKSLNMDENLFKYILEHTIHRDRILFKEGYITFKKTRAAEGEDNTVIIKPAHFNEKGEIEDISLNSTRVGEPYGSPSTFFSNSFSSIYGTLKYVIEDYFKLYNSLDDMWDLTQWHQNIYQDSEFMNNVETRKYRWFDSEGYWGTRYGEANVFKYSTTRDDRIGSAGHYYYLLYGKINDILTSVATK
ncbi:hypothetical protein SAMN05216357_11245 [Porphyromonadaceae bacterium KH3CP3RA]|nr:hypothetical protein SAMN05216357_11245 [Porphyromonadaceae bacterium KH3CP3RA]